MPMNPRTAEEVRQQAMAQIVAQTELTDMHEGGVAHTIAGVVGLQVAQVEQRIAQVEAAFNFGGRGADLDARVADLPGFAPRMGASSAAGRALKLRRADGTGVLTVPAGVRVASAATGLEYVTTEAATFNNGETQSTGLTRVVCLSTGAAGNAGAVALSVLVTAPADIVGCTNTAPLTSGTDAESDASLRDRARLWIASMSQVSKGALEYAARTFQSSDGTRARFAFVVEDVNRPGYCELVVDDGEGFQGSTRAGVTMSKAVGPNGELAAYFEAPAATRPTITPAPQTIVEERGIAYYNPVSRPMSGTVSASGYQVYTGFIAELQAVVEGEIGWPARSPGWRPVGGRVRVVAPQLEYIALSAQLVVQPGYDWNATALAATDAVFAYMQAHPPGQPLVIFQLAAALQRVPGVLDVRFSSNEAIYPSSGTSKLYPIQGAQIFNP